MSKSKSKSKKRAKALQRRLRKRTQRVMSEPVQAGLGSVAIIERALALQKSGQLIEAEKIYRKVLETEPENPDAWHLLGMALYSQSQFVSAIECLQCALTLTPNHPSVMANLGAVYRAAGDLDEAERVLERSIAFQPESFQSRTNLGSVYMELGKLGASEHQLKSALTLNPEATQARMNLANLWQKQHRNEEAEATYRALLQLQPNNPLLFNNLGESLRQQGRMDEAIVAMRRAVDLDPNAVEPRLHLAKYLGVSSCRDEAKSQLDHLIKKNPEMSKPFEQLGRLLLDVGQLDRAESCFRSAIKKDPAAHSPHGALLYVLSAKAFMDQQSLFEAHKNWGDTHGRLNRFRTDEQWLENRDRNQTRKLRIGYVSPDLRNHVIAYYFRPVLEQHNRDEFEIFCYGEIFSPDHVTDELKELSDHWRFTNGLSDRQVVKQIVDDEIDILVDLAGHTGGNRLRVFAFKPAPIQVTWLGYPNTTGLEAIDYRLTCETQNPRDEPSYHTEQLFYMPNGSYCFVEREKAPDVFELPAKDNSFVTFGALHRPEKVSEAALDLWAEVLVSCPESRLFVFHTKYNETSSETVIGGLNDRGVDRARIEVGNKIIGDHYLEAYRKIDIALDVVPWAGGTTTLEALWMGVPVIASFGDRRSARGTATVMNNVGQPSLVAKSSNEYCEIARSLANDLPRLEQLRKSLRQSVKATVLNHSRFTKELETCYRQMWHSWCQQPIECVNDA